MEEYVIDDELYCSEYIYCNDELFIACSISLGTEESDFFLYNVMGYYTKDADYQGHSSSKFTKMEYLNDPAVRHVSSDTLMLSREGNNVIAEIPNSYGTNMELNEETSVISLIGNDGNIISQVNLPAGKIIRNVEFSNGKLIFTFEDGKVFEVPLEIINVAKTEEVRKVIEEVFGNE